MVAPEMHQPFKKRRLRRGRDAGADADVLDIAFSGFLQQRLDLFGLFALVRLGEYFHLQAVAYFLHGLPGIGQA